MDKKNINGLKLALLSMCCLNLTSMIIAPTLSNVAAEYKEVSITWIQNLGVMSSLTAIISAQCSGFVMNYVAKKKLAIFSFLLYLVSGVSIFFVQPFSLLLILRCLNGLSLGFNSTISTSMIAEHFEGAERKKMMGMRMPFQNITAVLFSVLSGLLTAKVSWRYSYLLFLIVLLPLTLSILFLPNEASTIEKLQYHDQKPIRYMQFVKEYKEIIFLCIVHMLFVLATGINSTNITLLITEKNLGSANLGGIIAAIYLLTASATGLCFGWLGKICKKNLYLIACIITTIGMSCIACSKGLPGIVAGEIITGLGWSVMMARMNVQLAIYSDDRSRNITFSFFMAAMNLGTFFNPTVSTTISGLFAQSTAANRILVGAVILFLLIFIIGFYNSRARNDENRVIF